MKKFGTFIFAAIIGASSMLPATADAAQRLPGETALEMANRIDACDGAGVLSAEFTNDNTLLEVACRGLSGGLGTAGAVALGVVAIAVIAAAASGGGSSSSSTANP